MSSLPLKGFVERVGAIMGTPPAIVRIGGGEGRLMIEKVKEEEGFIPRLSKS